MKELDLTSRIDQKKALEVYAKIKKHSEFINIVDTMPIWVLILNSTRQAVYYNSKLGNDLGVTNKEQVLGKRPGELFSSNMLGKRTLVVELLIFANIVGLSKQLPTHIWELRMFKIAICLGMSITKLKRLIWKLLPLQQT